MKNSYKRQASAVSRLKETNVELIKHIKVLQ